MLALTLPIVLLGQVLASHAVAPTIELNDGNKIPVLALGTGRGTAREHDTLDLIKDSVFWAIEAGYRHIDTAAIYGDEKEVGEGIAKAIEQGLVKREDLFVTTKLWSNNHAHDKVIPALEESLRQLKLNYVDLYLIHFPTATKEDGTPENTDYLETWSGMEKAKELGLTKSIGVSNFNSSQITRVCENSRIKPAVNQFEVNPTLTQESLVDHCKKLGVAVMAYSPFGYMVSRKDKDAPPPRIDDPTLTKLASKYEKTTSQIVLRYLIDRGVIPIPKSTNKDRIKQNIELFDFKLTPEEIAAINKFNKNLRVINFKGWEKYPYFPFVKQE